MLLSWGAQRPALEVALQVPRTRGSTELGPPDVTSDVSAHLSPDGGLGHTVDVASLAISMWVVGAATLVVAATVMTLWWRLRRDRTMQSTDRLQDTSRPLPPGRCAD